MAISSVSRENNELLYKIRFGADMNNLTATAKRLYNQLGRLADKFNKETNEKEKARLEVLYRLKVNEAKKWFDKQKSINKGAADAEIAQVKETERRKTEIKTAELKSQQARFKASENKITSLITDQQKKRTKYLKDEATKQANTYIAKWKRAFGTLTRYMSAGVLIGAVTQFGRQMITEFLNVEKAIFRISGITGESISKTAKLTETIYGLASAYGIATDDVISFSIEMAKLGKTAKEIQKLGDATASLSVILGEDMSSSGKLLVTTMNQFNLVTSEASRVAGTFANVIKRSPLAVDDLKTAMQYIGVAASAAGIEIEQLGEYMTLLSNSGLKASKIGTGLRNVILRLAKDGRSFKDVMDDLYHSGLSLADALDLFGKRGATAGYLMVRNWGDLRDVISETPTAIEQMTTTLITASAKSNEFLKIWAKIKSISAYFVGNKVDPFKVVDDSSIDNMDKYSKSIQGVIDLYSKAGAETSSLFNLFYDDKLSKDVIVKTFEDSFIAENAGNHSSELLQLTRYKKELYEFLDIIDTQNKKEKELAAQRIKNSEDASKSLSKFAESVKNMDISPEQFDIGKTLTNNLLHGFGFRNEPFTEAEKLISDQYEKLKEIYTGSELRTKLEAFEKNLISTIAKAYSKPLSKFEEEVKVAIKAYEKAEIDIRNLGSKALTGNWDDLRTSEKELKANLKELCSDGIEWACIVLCEKWKIGCEKESGHSKYKSYLDTRVKKIKADLILARAYIQKKLQEEINKIDRLAEVKAKNDVKNLKNPEEFFKDQVDILGLPSLDDADRIEFKRKIDTAIARQISMMTASSLEYRQALVEANKKEVVKYEEEIKSLKAVREAGAFNPNNRKGENKKQWDVGLVAEIEKAEANLVKANKSLIKKIADEKFRLAKAIEIAKEKGISLDEAFILFDEKLAEDRLKAISALVNKGIGEVENIATEFMATAHENRMAMLDAELSAVQARYDVEGDILKASLDNNLITQETYEKKREELEKKRIDAENEIAEKQFEAKKKNDINAALVSAAADVAQAFVTAYLTSIGENSTKLLSAGITSSIIAGKTALNIAAIKKRKFYPTKYEDGGLVEGASHADGGVPFTVIGSSTPREMEGGEFIVRASRVNSSTLPMLDSINNSQMYSPTHFEHGGKVPISDSISGEDLKRLLDKPLRAYITTRDLDANNNRKTKTTGRTTLWK